MIFDFEIETEDHIAAVRAEVARIKESEDWSLKRIYNMSKVPTSTTSSFLSGSYKGDNLEVAKKLARWLRSREEGLTVARKIGHDDSFIATPSSASITTVLQYTHQARSIGVVVGEPGNSKTYTAGDYIGQRPDCYLMTLSPSTKTLNAALINAAQSLRIIRSRSAYENRQQLEDHLSGPPSLLIVDEAQNATMDILEELRSIHDATKCGLLLMGNEKIVTRLGGGGRHAEYAQLTSRFGMQHRCKPPTLEDVSIIAEAYGITQSKQVKYLFSISQGHGALRKMTKVISLAKMFMPEEDAGADIMEFLKKANGQLSARIAA